MIFLSLDPSWRVRLLVELTLDLTHAQLWPMMKDIRSFLTMDPFHTRIKTSLPGPIAPKDTFEIIHGFFGFGFARRARLLRYRESTGYAVSDISASGPLTGFPHIYSYRLIPLSDNQSRLTVSVRGKWTFRLLGRIPALLWLATVGYLIKLSLLTHIALNTPQHITAPASADSPTPP